MLFRGRNKKIKATGEEIFKLWSELGSIYKVSAYLTESGDVNPDSGKPFHPMTLWKNAIAWVVTHEQDARSYYETAAHEKLRDGDWKNFLVRTARNVYRLTPNKFYSWLEDNDWAYEYKQIWQNIFPHAPK